MRDGHVRTDANDYDIPLADRLAGPPTWWEDTSLGRGVLRLLWGIGYYGAAIAGSMLFYSLMTGRRFSEGGVFFTALPAVAGVIVLAQSDPKRRGVEHGLMAIATLVALIIFCVGALQLLRR